MMKIGFVLDDGLDKPDGVQQYILTLGDYYTQQGHEVRYLVGETTRTDLPDGVYSMAKNVKVRFNGNRLTIPLPTSRKQIKHVLAKEQFDVLHVQTPYSPFFGARVVLCADPQVTIIGTFHILPYNKITHIGTHALGFALRTSLKRFDAMVAVSKPASIFAKQTFHIESQVIPNSVNMDKYTNGGYFTDSREEDVNFNILFLGRLVSRKGCQQLLKALAILKSNDSLPTLVNIDICGDGPLRPELEKYVTHNQLSDIVTFHGFVTEEQKLHFMQHADIAVFPSLSGESFGIVLIEAMAAGSGVVLAGNNPGYESVLGEIEGSIIDAHKPEVFAAQLKTVIDDESLRGRLHDLQQAHVPQFDTKLVGDRLLDLYQTCKKQRSS